MKRLGFLSKKKGIISEYLPWILISLAVLVVLVIASYLLKDKGISVLDGIKNLFRGK